MSFFMGTDTVDKSLVMLTGGGATVSVAALLLTLPAELETSTLYDPASEACAFEMVWEAPVAPEMAFPFLYHW
jgi:hypothetical protein